MNHGAAIYLHHVREPARLDRVKFAVRAKSGIIDQQLDFDSLLFCELKYLFRRVFLGQICYKYFRLDLMDGGQFLRQLFQSLASPRCQNQIRSAARQFLGQRRADSSARSRHQCPFPRPRRHRVPLPKRHSAYHGVVDELFFQGRR